MKRVLGVTLGIFIGLALLVSSFTVVDTASSQSIIDSNTVTIMHPGITKLDYTSGNADYMGENVNADAADGDTDWVIYKLTWVDGNCTKIEKRTGSWTGRAALFA